jgi:PDZ domain-containing protein
MASPAIHAACVVRSVTDTTTTIVPPPPPSVPPPAERGPITRGPAWLGWLSAGLGFAVLVAILVLSLLPSSLVAEKENETSGEMEATPYALTPASAEAVTERITIGELPEGVERFETESDFYFVTVTSPAQTMLSWLAGRNDAAVRFITTEDKFGSRTPSQRTAINLQSMRTAEQEAQYVALTALGIDAEITPGEVVVEEMLCRTASEDGTVCDEYFPSDEQVDPADTLLEADGIVLSSVDDLVDALADKQPGDTVELLIDRPGEGEQTVTVVLSESPDEPGRAIVGFRPFDTSMVELPFEIDIRTDDIGGPSAGLAFTLALIDQLSPGQLSGGRDIAVTGTIGLDGEVGAIGGLAQKVSAVHQNGVKVFLVPASQAELSDPQQMQTLIDAGRGEVEIIPVATLDEALAVLEDLGGDPLVRAGDGP